MQSPVVIFIEGVISGAALSGLIVAWFFRLFRWQQEDRHRLERLPPIPRRR
jgi:hypothetical protein